MWACKMCARVGCVLMRGHTVAHTARGSRPNMQNQIMCYAKWKAGRVRAMSSRLIWPRSRALFNVCQILYEYAWWPRFGWIPIPCAKVSPFHHPFSLHQFRHSFGAAISIHRPQYVHVANAKAIASNRIRIMSHEAGGLAHFPAATAHTHKLC